MKTLFKNMIMTKKQILMLSLSLCMGLATFAQKSELKAAEKALKKADFTTVLSTLGQVEGLIGNADDKLKAKYYFLKGKALFGDGVNIDVDGVADAFNKLINVEGESGSSYSAEAGKILNNLIQTEAERAQTSFKTASESSNADDYKIAGKSYEKVFLLSPIDTSFLFNSALVYSIGKFHSESNEKYQQLLDLGYTGIATSYEATSVVDNQPKSFSSKAEMDKSVKLRIAENPKVEVSESKVNEIVKAMASNYIALGDTDKALASIAIARKSNPNDYDLIITEANIYFGLGNNVKFKEKLEEAIELNPTNANLYYNVGVMNLDLGNKEEATKNFKKAIELNPEYGEAYNNLGTIILSKSDAVQKELDANAMNFKKYDQIKEAKLLPIYREALPIFEKAYELSPSKQLMNLLNSFYENLSMDKRVE
jgi:tetratricopeptide (TPR) repeat protein